MSMIETVTSHIRYSTHHRYISPFVNDERESKRDVHMTLKSFFLNNYLRRQPLFNIIFGTCFLGPDRNRKGSCQKKAANKKTT